MNLREMESSRRFTSSDSVKHAPCTQAKDKLCTALQQGELEPNKAAFKVCYEHSLSACLSKSGARIVQPRGIVRFAGWLYRDEILTSYIGEQVFLRYDPRNITTVLVYQYKGGEEELIARPCVQNFLGESLSLQDSKPELRRKNRF